MDDQTKQKFSFEEHCCKNQPNWYEENCIQCWHYKECVSFLKGDYNSHYSSIKGSYHPEKTPTGQERMKKDIKQTSTIPQFQDQPQISSNNIANPVQTKKRGRPRKTLTTPQVSNVPKRPRGRPKKVITVTIPTPTV